MPSWIISCLIIILNLSMPISMHLQAALPPFYQSVREIDTILQDPELPLHLKVAAPIDAIERIEDGWRITAAGHTVVAKINCHSNAAPWVGPAQFTIEWIAD